MKLQLKRSNVLESGFAKAPTTAQMEYGELAVNYNLDDPCIFLKDSNNEIIRISGKGMPALSNPNSQSETLDDRYPLKSGATMTGELILFANPVSNFGAATKEYVDTSVGSINQPSDTSFGQNPPLNPTTGDFWWCTEDGTLYIYYQDIDSSQWVPAKPSAATDISLEVLPVLP